MVDFNEKGYLVSFPTSRMYTKAIYDEFQEFTGSYLAVCESMDTGDTDFKNLRRIVVNCNGFTFHSRLICARKDHCKSV